MIITKETEMTAIPKITFKEFASNPIVALLFLSVCATGALWYQNKVTLENHIAEYCKEVSILKKENKRTAKLVLFTFLIGPGLFVNGILKVWNERPRPRQVIEFNASENYQYPLSKWEFSLDKQSFPSGHASIAFFTSLTGLLFFKRYAFQIFLCGTLFGLCMGVARISVGGHFLTDILGAFFFTLLPYFMLKPKKGLLYKS